MPEILVNGVTRHYTDADFPQTLAILVAELQLDPQRLVAEVNNQVIGRASFKEQQLGSGDKIELIQFLGGG